MSLTGRRALITEANGAIGQQMSATITELGGDLVLVDREGTHYGALLEILDSSFDTEVTCIDCDLEDENAREELTSNISRKHQPLNILINNAALVGTSRLEGWAEEFEYQTVDTWRRALEVNLTAAFDLSKGLALKLKQSGHGTIINVASI